MNNGLRANLGNRETWLRGAFILLFALFWWLAQLILAAVVVFQFGATLMGGQTNPRALSFGAQLGRWFYEAALFATFWRDRKPWPFAAWPNEPRP